MNNELINADNLILLGATARNTGKTELAVRLIRRFSQNGPVAAVKVITVRNHGDICPRGGAGCGICKGLKSCFDITEEKGNGDKDTMLFRKAGAGIVYLVRAYPEGLKAAMEAVLAKIGPDVLVICESNSVRKVVKPKQFLMIADEGQGIKPSAGEVIGLADQILVPGQYDPESVLSMVRK